MDHPTKIHRIVTSWEASYARHSGKDVRICGRDYKNLSGTQKHGIGPNSRPSTSAVRHIDWGERQRGRCGGNAPRVCVQDERRSRRGTRDSLLASTPSSHRTYINRTPGCADFGDRRTEENTRDHSSQYENIWLMMRCLSPLEFCHWSLVIAFCPFWILSFELGH